MFQSREEMIEYPPRIKLASLPTPFKKLEKFSVPGFNGNIWIKHDEMTGTEVSGNKVRKLEYCIAHALKEKCNTLITCGGIQSNHCRATAVLGAKLGLKVHLILRGEKPEFLEGNLLLDHLAGARISYLPKEEWNTHTVFAEGLKNRLGASGDKAHFIPTGASDEIGIWGYIAAWEELVKDFVKHDIEPDYVVMATGSGGTQAGLLVGSQIHRSLTKIVAFNVCDDASYFENKINMDVSLWKQRYDVVFDETKLDIKTFEGYAGPAYGEAENIVFKMIANLAKVEGVFLDPVYTGKAFHGMVTELSLGDQGRLPGAKNIVFVHTGGLFGVFPHHKNFKFD